MSGEAQSLAHLPEGYLVGGKYVIKRLLGEGANGSVYEGEHSEIGHRVAIKVVHKALAAREDIIARFRREARICGTIRNRHVGQVYDVGELPEGAPFMVMELQEGRSLAHLLSNEGPLPIAAAIDMVSQLLVGLQAVHDTGAIHRDVKPDNVMLVRESSGQTVVKLVDFGIGKSMTTDIRARNVTQEGMVVGSPDYMPPEQLRGDEVDHRVDIYAAGVVLYELIAGRMPFNATTLTELFVAILRDPITPPSQLRADCPPELQAVILRSLSRDANERFQSAREMGAALVEVQRNCGMRAGDLGARYSAPPSSASSPQRVQTGTRRAATTSEEYVLETERVRTAELRLPVRRNGVRYVLGALALFACAVALGWLMRPAREESLPPAVAPSERAQAANVNPAVPAQPVPVEPAAAEPAAAEPPAEPAPAAVAAPAVPVAEPEPNAAASDCLAAARDKARPKKHAPTPSATEATDKADRDPEPQPARVAAKPAAPAADASSVSSNRATGLSRVRARSVATRALAVP